MNSLRIVIWTFLVVLARPYQVSAQGAPFTSQCLLTITNPAPADDDFFGTAVAVVGTDKLLIGAREDYPPSSAYLFDLNGTLSTIFTTPNPTNSANNDSFGSRVAAVGTDKVLIGADQDDRTAPNAGAAYLFNLSGTLLNTFTSPTPATEGRFGLAVAGIGSEKILIGAPGGNSLGENRGTVYLFDLNGTVLTTFTNPAPAMVARFGWSLAALGNDRVLIGAPFVVGGQPGPEAVYLFELAGTLLTTFTNPAPATGGFVASDEFGSSITGVGTDKVLIGATGAGQYLGATYLFDLTGTLLTTFTNPFPTLVSGFGHSVAAWGSDKVLIGSSGAVFLFDLSGALLTTITNPSVLPSANEDEFGNAVAILGSDKVLIGAGGVDIWGGEEAGAAYLFCLRPPLRITRTNETVTISWEKRAADYVLDCTTNLLSLTDTLWSQVPFPYETNTTQISVTMAASGVNKFYRLRKP